MGFFCCSPLESSSLLSPPRMLSCPLCCGTARDDPWTAFGTGDLGQGMGRAHKQETLDLWSCFNPELCSGNPCPAKAPAGLSLWVLPSLPWENSWGYSCWTAPGCSATPQILIRGENSQRNSLGALLSPSSPIPAVPHPRAKALPAFLIPLGIPRYHSNIYSQHFFLPVCAPVLPSHSGQRENPCVSPIRWMLGLAALPRISASSRGIYLFIFYLWS